MFGFVREVSSVVMTSLEATVLLMLVTKCVAVNIRFMDVPPLVALGTASTVLDCEYSVQPEWTQGLVIKWFFNQQMFYQWIPPMDPQVVGLFKNRIDKTYKASDKPLEQYRAIKILSPTTELSGNYSCVVSTFHAEERQTKHMLVYSAGKNFHFVQEKKYVFIVTLLCVAEEMYPKPEMIITVDGKPLKQTTVAVTMNAWGLYDVTASAVVHDDDVARPAQEFVCELRLPGAEFHKNVSTLYYPGLMPAIESINFEARERRSKHESHSSLSSEVNIFSIFFTFLIALCHFY